MKKLPIIITVCATAFSTITQAGITGFTLQQSNTSPGSSTVNLTAEGTVDWGIFAQGPGEAAGFDLADKPYESKSGGTGFTSIAEMGGASWNTNDSFTLSFSQRVYSWTDGTVAGSAASTNSYLNAYGRVLTHDGAGTGFPGAGTRLTVDVTEAGTYQLKYYAATFNLALDASAMLLSEGIAFDEFSPVTSGIEYSALDDYVFTVDFTTTGADTLLLDVVNSSTNDGAYALEAFTLSGTGTPPEIDLGNVWPLGDSITDGVDGYGTRLPGGYREPLYTNLTARGYTLQFVGTSSINPSPLLTAEGQQMHDGHSGWTIANIEGRSGLYEQVNSWYAGIPEPDIILLMIGINDLNHDFGTATAPDRLDLLITRLFELDPDIRILISTLLDAEQDNPYRGDGTNDIIASVSAYNAAMRSMVVDRRALGQNIELVDMHAGLTLADLDDGLHPNAAGHVKMSKIWTDAIIADPPNFTGNAAEVSAGMVSFTASGALGTSYSLWTSEDLTTNNWTLMSYDSITTNPFTVMNAATNTQQFYRFSAP